MNHALRIASGILLMPVVLALGLWVYLFQVYPRLSLPTGCGAKSDTFEVRCNDRTTTKVLHVNGLPYPTSLDKNDFKTQLLSGAWKWRLDEEEIGEQHDWHETQEADASWENVTVPSTYNVPSGKYKRHQGVTWYMRRFVSSPWDPHNYYPRLSFRGVFLRYKIWLNGQLVGTREGAYTPVYFDVSKLLKPGQPNVIVVRADNRLTFSSMPPKNRQDHKHGWGIWGGIYRDVLLETVPRQNVFKVRVLPKLAGANSSFSVTLGTHNHGRKKPYTLKTTLVSPSGRTVHTKTIEHTPAEDVAIHKYTAPVASPETYSPSTPRTYTLNIAFASGSIRQNAVVKPGMRSLAVKNAQILLNGKPILLRGICKHEDDPVHGATQNERIIRRDLDLVRELGANYVRLAHYPHAVRELQIARDMGLLLAPEIPYYIVGTGFTSWFEEAGSLFDIPLSTWGMKQLNYEPLSLNTQRELIEMIERDINNPAIILWSVANETYTLQDAAADMHGWLRDIARDFDSTRLVTMSEFTYDIPLLDSHRQSGKHMDVISLNSYYGWFYGEVEDLADDLDELHARYPDKPIIVTEFGADAGLGRKDSDGVWQAHEPGQKFAYGSYGRTLSESFQTDLYERYFEVVKARPYMAGMAPWLLADFHGPSPWFERNLVPGYVMKGLVTKERVKKKVFYTLRDFYRTWQLLEEGRAKQGHGLLVDEQGERSG
jgi:beta-glucuronidase